MREHIYTADGKPLANENGEISLARDEIVRYKDCEFYQPDMYVHFTCECLYRLTMPDDFVRGVKEKKGLNNEREPNN